LLNGCQLAIDDVEMIKTLLGINGNLDFGNLDFKNICARVGYIFFIKISVSIFEINGQSNKNDNSIFSRTFSDMKCVYVFLGLALLILLAEARPQDEVEEGPVEADEAAKTEDAPAKPVKINRRQGCPQLDDKLNPVCAGKNTNCRPCIERLLKCPVFSKDEAPTECLQKVVCYDSLVSNDEEFFAFCTTKQNQPLEE
jgi:hypothetical protein